MLMPKRVKHRKQFRGRMRGMAKGGTDLMNGEFGLQATSAGWISSRQIEAMRRVLRRYLFDEVPSSLVSCRCRLLASQKCMTSC